MDFIAMLLIVVFRLCKMRARTRFLKISNEKIEVVTITFESPQYLPKSINNRIESKKLTKFFNKCFQYIHIIEINHEIVY